MKEDLTKGSIPNAIRTMALPASIGMFFHAMYNLTDTFYAGQLSLESLAALTFTFPLFFLILALGSGINVATNAFVSKKIGEKDKQKGIELGAQGISLALVSGIIFAFLGFVFIDDLLMLVGAQGETLALALEYMNVVLLAIPLIFIHWTVRGILGSIGDTKTPGMLMIMTFFLNLILDPILMYGYFGFPALGIAGVALATVLLIFVELLILIYVANKKQMICRILDHYILNAKITLELIKQAIPASLTQANTALGFLIITFFVSDFGENAIATFGIGGRIDQLIILPAMGVGLAAISIVGQNYGAKNYQRVLQAYQTSIKYSSIPILIGVVLIFLFSGSIASFFTQDEVVIQMIMDYIQIVTLSYIPVGIIMVSGATLQGLGRAQDVLVINLMRVFVLSIPCFWVFAYLLDLKEMGIWIGLAFSSILIASVAYFYVIRVIKNLEIKK